MSVTIKFISGEVEGFDQPAICKSGRPACAAKSAAPLRDGWKFAQVSGGGYDVRNGWWCNACVLRMEKVLATLGGRKTSKTMRLGSRN